MVRKTGSKKRECSLAFKKLSYQETGDHWLYVFNVLKSKTINHDYLDTYTLSEKKIIRI